MRAQGAAFSGLKQYADLRHRHQGPAESESRVGGPEVLLTSPLNRSGRARPRNVEEALAQSRKHARLALSEVLRSVSYLIDAAALALGAGQNPLLDSGWTSLIAAIDETARKLAGVQVKATPEDRVMEIMMALETEITRWEGRANHDAHAEAVLIAFVGLREMIHEIQGGPEPGPPRARSRGAQHPPAQPRQAPRLVTKPSYRTRDATRSRKKSRGFQATGITTAPHPEK